HARRDIGRFAARNGGNEAPHRLIEGVTRAVSCSRPEGLSRRIFFNEFSERRTFDLLGRGARKLFIHDDEDGGPLSGWEILRGSLQRFPTASMALFLELFARFGYTNTSQSLAAAPIGNPKDRKLRNIS